MHSGLLLVIIKLYSLDVTSEALRAKIDQKSVISLQHSQFDTKFQVEEDVPHQYFSNECPTTLLLAVLTQINFVAAFFKRSAILEWKRPFCVIDPLLGTYGQRTMIILGSLGAHRLVDFPLVLIEHFSLYVTAEALSVQNRRFRSNGGRLTRNFRLKGRPHQLVIFLRKLDYKVFRMV